MDKSKILTKFGRADYIVDDATYIMGVHHLLSDRIAKRFRNYNVVLDACAGAGFMSIAIAKYVKRVITVDINKKHLDQAQKNAYLSSIHNIEFTLGDVVQEIPKLKNLDAAFLDPDWSKLTDQKRIHVSRLAEMRPSALMLLQEVSKLTPNICLRVPREIEMKELDALPVHEVEPVSLDSDLKFYCIYFGDLIQRV